MLDFQCLGLCGRQGPLGSSGMLGGFYGSVKGRKGTIAGPLKAIGSDCPRYTFYCSGFFI